MKNARFLPHLLAAAAAVSIAGSAGAMTAKPEAPTIGHLKTKVQDVRRQTYLQCQFEAVQTCRALYRDVGLEEEAACIENWMNTICATLPGAP